MATKRVFVPTALHAELTEYTNLVRALRTARTLDLTSHLLQHATQHKRKEKEKDVDTWTHWPLIDCPVPEWSLEDEIRQLGETVVQHQARARDGSEADDDGLDQDSDADSDLKGAAATCLVLHTGSVLVHILNLMADQRPLTPGSMQNRLWAMNWEDILSLLAVGGVIDPTYALPTPLFFFSFFVLFPFSSGCAASSHVPKSASNAYTDLVPRKASHHTDPLLPEWKLTSLYSIGKAHISRLCQSEILENGIHSGGSITRTPSTLPNASERHQR